MGSGYDLFNRQMLSGGRQAQNMDALISMYRNALGQTHNAALSRKALRQQTQFGRPGPDWGALAAQLGSSVIGAYGVRSAGGGG